MEKPTFLEFAEGLARGYETFRIDLLPYRRFTPEFFQSLLAELASSPNSIVGIRTIGNSFEGRPISLVSVGDGDAKILLWSQMHGDESTATMAIADILNYLIQTPGEKTTQTILSSVHLLFLPILNPDGAARFQRRTAQGIDMNRDALALRTPEARILRNLQQQLKPDFGFNLHDQELSTVGSSKELTAIALLSPAFDESKSDNPVRLRAEHLASVFAATMNQFVPGRVARYDESFEPRAFGDNMQHWGTSTVLVESGHEMNDPEKSTIRKLNFIGLLASLYAIATGEYSRSEISLYETLPFNGKRAYDVIIRNAEVKHEAGTTTPVDIGISYQVDTHTNSIPRLVDLGDLHPFVGLREVDGKGLVIAQSSLVIGEEFDWERHVLG